MVEREPSKLEVAGSNPVSRSIWSDLAGGHIAEAKAQRNEIDRVGRRDVEAASRRPRPKVNCAHVAQSVEHFLGKEEVKGPIPFVGFHLRPDYAIVLARSPRELEQCAT